MPSSRISVKGIGGEGSLEAWEFFRFKSNLGLSVEFFAQILREIRDLVELKVASMIIYDYTNH
jgi:hypothetical protein